MPDTRPTCIIPLNNPRIDHWLYVFERLDDIPITSWLPSFADVANLGRQEIYFMDFKRVSAQERERLIENLAKVFKEPPDAIAQGLDKNGLVILAKDVVVAIPMRLIS